VFTFVQRINRLYPAQSLFVLHLRLGSRDQKVFAIFEVGIADSNARASARAHQSHRPIALF